MKMMNGLFSVVFYDGEAELPDDKLLYIVTKKGTFLRKNLGTITSCTKVDNISFLKELEPYAELKIPQMNKGILSTSLGFLKWVYDVHSTEGGLIIYYNSKTREYVINAPVQEVSFGGVHWDNRKEPYPKGFIRMGTIHSHANMSAFHSGTDIEDEHSFDGLHLTVGNLGENIPTLVASIVANGTRFPIKEENIRKYLDIQSIVKTEEEKKKVVEKSQESQSPIYEDYQSWQTGRNCGNEKNHNVKTYNYYSSYMGSNEMKLVIPNTEPRDFDFPNEWRKRVSKRTFTPTTYKVVGGKLVESKPNGKIGFVPKGNWSEDDWNWMGAGYYANPQGQCSEHINSNLPMKENNWKVILTDAVERGLVDLEKDYGISSLESIDEIEFEKEEEEDIQDFPTGLDEEDFHALYGQHSENEDHLDDIHFDDAGNIVDGSGKIIEKLTKD